jgi:pilus assembly protein Flp/PilA
MLNKMGKAFLNYVRDEEGQTSTEYILLVAVVAMIIFKFKGIAESKLTELTTQVFDQASSGIKLE